MQIEFHKINGGVLAPEGFIGGAAACGIKNGKPERLDLALVVSQTDASAAATFTTNRVKAAPVKVSAEHVKSGRARAVVLNSGNANACTGKEGLAASRATARAVAKKIGCLEKEVLVCSTGRIGVALPLDRIQSGLAAIEPSRTAGTDCAHAIMTSDTKRKEASYEVVTQRGTFRIGAMAKGAGMIDPNMATMLCVFTTDAKVPPATLRKALREAVAESFNRITVDGDMSTNDTVIALANGLSGVVPTTAMLREALVRILREMARHIVLDGECVTRLVQLNVRGAASPADARRAAEAVANSTLVKSAWAGGDPNWGRILCALGYSGAKMIEEKVSVDYDELPLVRNGSLAKTDWKKIREVAAQKEFCVDIDLHIGRAAYEVWTTDLTPEYVKFNMGE